MSSTAQIKPATGFQTKYFVFAVIAAMMAYVIYHNERFLLDPAHPVWQHYDPLKWWLLPHGLAGVLALFLAPLQFSDRLRTVQAGTRVLGLRLHVENASGERDIDAAFARFVQQRVNALFVAADAFFLNRRDQLVALAARHALPATYNSRDVVAAGGLMSYGTNRTDVHRQMGVYTGRILKGEKPADLPVMQPTKFEFVINLKTAKALGHDVPAKLLALTDEVIE